MKTSGFIPADVSKEIRALLPIWLGSVAVVCVGEYDYRMFRVAFLAYLLGTAALGALSIGHEYTNRTLPMLLSAPISRRRMFATKASVLIGMLLVLGGVATLRLPVMPAGRDMRDTAIVGVLTLFSSAFVAPWITMRTRNVIAGAVFALCIPAGLLVGSELLALAVTGRVDSPAFQSFRMQAVWTAMLFLSVIGALSTWHTFMHLEAVEGSHSHVRLPRLFARTASVSQPINPMSALVRKELRLQQLTFAVAGLYVCGWILAFGIGRMVGADDIDDVLLILTVVHGAIVALLSGSLASAEERHLGVLESQVLMPMATARQWAVKVGVVFGLCVLLGLILPVVLTWVSLGIGSAGISREFIAIEILLAAVGLYVSSVSGSGMKALLLAGPAALFLLGLIRVLADLMLWVAGIVHGIPFRDPFGPVVIALTGAIVVGGLMRFALTNHRSSDRSALRVWSQLFWLSGSVVCITLIAVIAR